MTINLEQANQIIAGAFSEAVARQMKPVTVAVLDAGGHLTAFQKSDGSPTLRHAIAIGKASAALGLGVSSRRVGEMAAERPHFVAAAGALSPTGFVPVPGAVLVVDDTNRPIGAVGVSGDTSDNDEICALAGIASAGLKPQQ